MTCIRPGFFVTFSFVSIGLSTFLLYQSLQPPTLNLPDVVDSSDLFAYFSNYTERGPWPKHGFVKPLSTHPRDPISISCFHTIDIREAPAGFKSFVGYSAVISIGANLLIVAVTLCCGRSPCFVYLLLVLVFIHDLSVILPLFWAPGGGSTETAMAVLSGLFGLQAHCPGVEFAASSSRQKNRLNLEYLLQFGSYSDSVFQSTSGGQSEDGSADGLPKDPDYGEQSFFDDLIHKIESSFTWGWQLYQLILTLLHDIQAICKFLKNKDGGQKSLDYEETSEHGHRRSRKAKRSSQSGSHRQQNQMAMSPFAGGQSGIFITQNVS